MDPAPVPDLVADFLHIAGKIHQAASALHDGDAAAGLGALVDPNAAEQLSAGLSAVVKSLDAAVLQAENRDHALLKACRKVGLDLLVHLGRFASLNLPSDGAACRELWPEPDVQALAERLRDLINQWKDQTHDSRNDEILSRQLLLLDINSAESSLGRGASRRKNASGLAEQHAGTATITKDAQKPANQGRQTKKLLGAEKPRPTHTPTGILEDFILDGLAYSSMRSREEEVTEAHQKTLEWIFEKDDGTPPTGRQILGRQFTKWLTTDELGPIYWITGKPGSGKSTLMRFFFEQKITTKKLQLWAGARPVTVAGFFFWTSGSREQRSQTGLLRYLLYQLLSINRKLIPEAFPALWQKLQTMTTKERILYSIEWTASDLMRSLNSFLDAALQHMNVALFIDGLDEFDGDHQTIVEFFKGLSESGDNRLKLCLSSRPWDVFQRAFGNSVPNMRLQDLSHDDMVIYAKDRLIENPDVHSLSNTSSEEFEALVEETVERADGVFLWVRLAINRILAAVGKNDSLNDLAVALRSLPTELDNLFEKFIFKEQTGPQIAETSILFQLIHGREIVADFIRDESANSLTVWELAFALDDEDDAGALRLPIEEASEEEIQQRSQMTSTTIHKRFAGLIDLYIRHDTGNVGRGLRFSDKKVQVARATSDKKLTYIHRTVRDWLMSADGVKERLFEHSPEHFDPHLRLLRSYILRLKLPLEEPERHRRLNEWWPDIALALTHARHIQRDPLDLQRLFVNELDKTMSWYWVPRARDPNDHWSRSAFGSYEIRMKAAPIQHPFLCLAAKFGLTRYLCSELEARSTIAVAEEEEAEKQEPGSAPLLVHATEFLCSRNRTIYPLSDPELVSYLLDHPSSINPGASHTYLDFVRRFPLTPWVAVLRHLRDARRRGWIQYYDIDPQGTARWAAIVEMFILVGGADIAGTIVEKDAFDPEISAVGVLQLLEDTYGAVEVRDLKLLLA